jgi:hypothetical protein
MISQFVRVEYSLIPISLHSLLRMLLQQLGQLLKLLSPEGRATFHSRLISQPIYDRFSSDGVDLLSTTATQPTSSSPVAAAAAAAAEAVVRRASRRSVVGEERTAG